MSQEIAFQDQAFVPPHMRVDPPRPEARVRVRVHFHDAGAARCNVATRIIERPKDISHPVEFECWESEVPGVREKVETHLDEIPLVRKAYLAALRREAVNTGVKPDDVAGEISTWPEDAKRVLELSIDSFDKHWFAIVGHSIRPLRSVEVVGVAKPAPKSASAADELAELRAMNAALLERLERLERKK